MMTRSTLLSRIGVARGGASSIEFALIAAFLILPLTLGIYDFGTALYRWMEVGNAARAGAQFINVNGYSSSDNTATLSCTSNNFTCAIQASTPLGSSVTVSVGTAYCGCQSGTQYYVKTYSPPCCSASNPGSCCPTGQTSVTMAQVNATYSYKPIFTYFGFGPSSGIPLSAQATALIF
jgi:Flp pilus assembly protein TadG